MKSLLEEYDKMKGLVKIAADEVCLFILYFIYKAKEISFKNLNKEIKLQTDLLNGYLTHLASENLIKYEKHQVLILDKGIKFLQKLGFIEKEPKRIQKKTKILILDDDSISRELLVKYLESCEIIELPEVIELPIDRGLKRLEKSKFHIVVVDIRLPDLARVKVLEEIKEINQNLPLIIIASHKSVREKAEEILKGRMGSYIIEPPKLDELGLIVKSAIDSSVKTKGKEEELISAVNDALNALAKGIDLRDPFTEPDSNNRSHSNRVMEMVGNLSNRLNIHQDEIEKLKKLVLMHDINRVGLDKEEFQEKFFRIIEDGSFADMKFNELVEILQKIMILLCHLHRIRPGLGHYLEYFIKEDTSPKNYIRQIIAIADIFDVFKSGTPFNIPMRDDTEVLARIRGLNKFDDEVISALEDEVKIVREEVTGILV